MSWYKPWTWADQSDDEKMQSSKTLGAGDEAGALATRGQNNFENQGANLTAQQDAFRRLANGQDSLSSEQLRQGLQQNQAAQMSMAAGAAPQNQAMAARTAAIQNARLGYGMSGQQAMAGIQERNAAQGQLSNLMLQQRQQELQASLGGRQAQLAAYGNYKPEGSFIEQWGQPITNGISAYEKSDRRAKTKIKDADSDAGEILDGLKSYAKPYKYEYKDKRDGEGERFSLMAQDLEKVGLKHTVVDTPGGKMVHTGRLAGSLAALMPNIAKRLSKLEGGRK